MGAVTVQIWDLGATDTALADISDIALEKTLTKALNEPSSFVVECPAGHELLTTVAGDGYPNLRRGNRKLVVWEDGITDPVFHGRIWLVERDGDGTENLVTITAYDALFELGYDSDDHAGRPVRGSATQPDPGDFGTDSDPYNGNFIQPLFASQVADQDGISGPDLIQQVLTNSQQTGNEGDETPGEGPLPIDVVSGDFDVDVPPAVDLSCVDSMDWPVLIGDFIAQLVETNVVDVLMRPITPGTGTDIHGNTDPYIMVELSAKSSLGTDLSDTVHFDYFTGSLNAKACRHVEDFSTINNKLYIYLGPRGSATEWAGNITPGDPDVTVDPTDSRALYGGPGDTVDGTHGQFMTVEVQDSVGTEDSSRPLYIALWNGEQGDREEPRDLLYITPADGPLGLFDALVDYDVGDLIAINVGAALGVVLADVQRVHGFTKTWTREDVSQVSELLTSADPA